MTDKELLELAAKAFWGSEIGDTCSVRWSEKDESICYMHGDNQDHDGRDVELCWNPLDWYHDALQLSVKLGISIEYVRDSDGRIIGATTNGHEFECVNAADPGAATCRAIVRAAAEIGAKA